MLPYLIRPKSSPYFAKMKGLFGADLLAYWPMSEASGSTGLDVSGNSRNGTYANITLGQPGIGDGTHQGGGGHKYRRNDGTGRGCHAQAVGLYGLAGAANQSAHTSRCLGSPMRKVVE